MKTFDAIIIGAGQSGVPLAKKLAGEGLKTALVEKRLIGGTCINDGCTPTKTMIASGRVAHIVSKSSDWGVITNSFTIDIAAIKKRKDEVVKHFREGSERGLLETKGLEIICGEAVFTGKKKLLVTLNTGGAEEITADKIFIDTGTKPTIPNIEGIHDINYLTSTTILDLNVIPKHLLVIGSGDIALEFGQLYQRLGSKVTILEHGPHFLKHEDADVSDEVKKILQENGVAIQVNAAAKKMSKAVDGMIEVTIEVEGIVQQITCSHVLLAAGRTPQTKALCLEKTGVATGKQGTVEVNDKLETNVAGIYAMGDVNGGPQFTHISYNDYLIIYRNLFHNENYSTKDRLVPYCVYIDPQLGRIGITENEAREKGLDVHVAKLPMTNVARAIETNETRGFIKAVVDKANGKILGAAVLGVEGGEIMSVLQMAMMGGVTYKEIRDAIFAHPTFSEALNNLFMKI